jgi:predicted ATP-dependent Lon-type protease
VASVGWFANTTVEGSIRADGSILLVGNFEVDVQHQQRVGYLFGPLPPEMRNDTAFMDRIPRICRAGISQK